MEGEARAQVTSQAGWGGRPGCAGSASPGTGPARPPHAPGPSGPASLEKISSGEVPSQHALPPCNQPERVHLACIALLLPPREDVCTYLGPNGVTEEK